MKIEFYSVANKKYVPKFSHSVAPHHPGRLATRAKTLIYQDQGSSAHGLRGLNCSTYPPKGANINCIPSSKEFIGLQLLDMIGSVTLKSDELIIKSFGSGGICASHKTNGKMRWKVKGRLPGMQKSMIARGIDTDGRGHLFVCDTANQCIQMFSLNGDYLGVLLRSGEQDLGTPFRIRWCRRTSSVVVLHHRNDRCCMSVLCAE